MNLESLLRHIIYLLGLAFYGSDGMKQLSILNQNDFNQLYHFIHKIVYDIFLDNKMKIDIKLMNR